MRRRGPGYWLLYGLYLLCAVAALGAASHGVRTARLARHLHPLPDAVDEQTAGRLGFLHEPEAERLSFLTFPQEKPPGVLRIGCFGDSFTWGSEVDPAHSYPAQLQALLRAAGAPDVQVVNFGNPGYGFHQVHALWERFARAYALDLAVLFPRPFWPARDTTFWPASTSRFALHARYVLGPAGLERIDVLGGTARERFDQYQRLLPHARYLRYDRRPPAFLRAWLPPGRTLANPFYYRGDDPRSEAFASYRALLARMAAEGMPIWVADVEGSFVAMVEALATESVVALRIRRGRGFPYRAPAGHSSPWGNRLVAEQLARRVRPEGTPTPTRLELSSVPPAPPAAPAGHALDTDTRASVEIAGRPVGGFSLYRPDSRRVSRRSALGDAASLLAIPLSGQLADGLWLPGSEALEETLEITLDLGWGGRTPLGQAVRHAPWWASFDLCGALVRHFALADGASCSAPRPPFSPEPEASLHTIRFAGRPALRAAVVTSPPRIELAALADHYRLRPDGDLPAAVDDLPDRGLVTLVLDGARGDRVRVPIARYRKRPLPEARLAP